MTPLKISIPAAREKSPEHGKAYTEYSIKVEHPFPRAATSLAKRYSDFSALDASLRAAAGCAPPAALPAKSWGFGGLLGLGGATASPDAVEKRRAGLEQYLRAIEGADDGRWRSAAPYRAFLELDDKDAKKAAASAGSQYGKDAVRDSSDWLDKHSELKSSLQDARRSLTAREQAAAATAQHEAAANAKKSLMRAATLIAVLEEGLGRLSGSSRDEGSEKLGDGEVRRRRDMISGLRKEKDGLESVLTSMAVKAANAGSLSASSAAVTQEQKAGLFKGATKPSGRRVLGAPVETERTRQLDNEGLVQLRKQIVAEQDEDLVDLTLVVRRMKEMGAAINTEIVEQNELLGLMEDDVERVDGKIKIANKRIKKL
jgi:regulator of vacuolar morphogenesis